MADLAIHVSNFRGTSTSNPGISLFAWLRRAPFFLLRSPHFAAVALPKVCYDTRPQNPVVCYMDGIDFDGV